MIAIGCDHAGLNYKNLIADYFFQNKIEFKDFGTNDKNSVDYPQIAKLVAGSIQNGSCKKGILICGTGIGMSIAANKFKGIVAALCKDEFCAIRARSHNNANIMCIGELVTPQNELINMVNSFLTTNFDGGRHEARVQQIHEFETPKI